MRKYSFLIIALILSSLLPIVCLADQAEPKCLEAVEFLTGFQWAKLLPKNRPANNIKKRNFYLFPFLVDFDFNLKPLAKKINFNPNTLLQFQIEPFISYVSKPDSNVETGTNFFLKMGLLPQTSKLQPFIKAGVGLSYMTQHTVEQSTQFNFTEQGALGMHYFFCKNIAFTMEGRFRHLSNCRIREPNHGINTILVAGGITYQF